MSSIFKAPTGRMMFSSWRIHYKLKVSKQIHPKQHILVKFQPEIALILACYIGTRGKKPETICGLTYLAIFILDGHLRCPYLLSRTIGRIIGQPSIPEAKKTTQNIPQFIQIFIDMLFNGKKSLKISIITKAPTSRMLFSCWRSHCKLNNNK